MKPEHSYAEISRALGITPQEVSRLERQALKKMRAYCEQRGYDFTELQIWNY